MDDSFSYTQQDDTKRFPHFVKLAATTGAKIAVPGAPRCVLGHVKAYHAGGQVEVRRIGAVHGAVVLILEPKRAPGVTGGGGERALR